MNSAGLRSRTANSGQGAFPHCGVYNGLQRACTPSYNPISQAQPSFHSFSHRSLRSTVAHGVRRSPVVTPDVVIGGGSEDERQVDLFRYLLQNRIVFLGGYINDKIATQVVGSLLALEAMDDKQDIRLYINSTGGQPYSVIGVVDTLLSIKPQVQTLALGCCYSYSSVLLAAGAQGKRSAMKNTRIMMTQPMGGSQGDIYQIQKTVEELNAIYQLTARYYMKFTGMDQDTVERNTCRDYFMTPEEAVQNGLIDTVVRGKDDYRTPPSVIRNLREAGLIDELSGGLLRV